MDDRTLFLERLEILDECAARYAGLTAGQRFGHTLMALLSRIATPIDEDDLIVGRVPEVLPTEAQEAWIAAHREALWAPPWFHTDGHLTISWPRILNEGMAGIRRRAEERLGEMGVDDDGDAISRSQRDFLTGVMLCCEAIALFGARYAQEAEAQARRCPTPERAEELRRIAAVCRRAPEQPARTFHEAVQAIWLVDLVLHAVVGARDFALGRLDQYLWPFYARDLVEGRITPQEAQELIECLYIKCSEIIGYADQANARKRSRCQDSVQYVVLGGSSPDGDATNPLSLLCLRAGFLKLKQPTIKVRYHPGIDPAFWRETCALIREGGAVGVYNDDVVVPAFLSVGVEPQDAWDYVHYGCCNANVPGHEGSLMERWHNLPKLLELALHDGVDPLTDERVGPKTGDVGELRSLDDLLAALQGQIRHALEAERALYPPLSPEALGQCSFTLESAFLEGCIERGREWRLGGAKYWHKSQHGVGIATVADSLAAIQQVVFDEGELTLAELRDILDADYVGHETLRLRLRNRCAKYGNDDEGVDALAARVANLFCDEVLRCNEAPHDVRFWPEIYSYHNNRRMGVQVGATPDGRRRGEVLSENQSPTLGVDRHGPSACLNSIARLPFQRTPGGGTNLKLHPSAVEGEAGLQALSDLMRTYFHNGGQHLQVNVIDAATLREAQQHPERHRSLSVRVVGYSAYFVTLSPEVQEDLIRRTEHAT
jgi:trans-4-hydroxy-L-proline dehydratase